VAYQAEYIWLDGTEPTPMLRSKTKIMHDDTSEMPVWGFDGSSTNQATGDKSDCVLKPVFTCHDPIRGGRNVLVMCEVMLVNGRPHPTNTRAAARAAVRKYAEHDMWFGMEQEYTMLRANGRPLGFPEGGGLPAPQGPYYCGVGTGQWEFQIGPAGPTEVGDHLHIARWLLHRIAEDYDVIISFAAKPEKGDWNGAGCHTNFSNNAMRNSYDAVIAACDAVGDNYLELLAGYGDGIKERLTGAHETASWEHFSYGVSDRGSSIRIPWQVAVDKKGYAEDRRPNANCDPYTVARMLTEVVCGEPKKPAKKSAAKKK
jgi:glutamine synthetase